MALAAFGSSATAQEEETRTIHVTPASLEMKVGQTKSLEVVVVDAAGNVEDVPVVFFTGSRGALVVDQGEITARAPGSFEVTVRTARASGARASIKVPVTVAFAQVQSIEFVDAPGAMFVGASYKLATRVHDEIGERPDVVPTLTSSDESVASIDAFGRVVAKSAGFCEFTATAGGTTGTFALRVTESPVASVRIEVDKLLARTGDVLQFRATALDASGSPVEGAPMRYSTSAQLDDDLGPAASGQVGNDGRFVAQDPGLYTVTATSGSVSASETVRALERDAQREVRLVGRGTVTEEHTSDLWVWEGIDGRDYAVTGTWGANGDAVLWDVTDPANMEQINRVKVDARTVNDVKVSPDGTLCILSREGASNRKNGIVIVDVRDPAFPEVISTFTENLTGGVHNLFIWNDHVFALSAGRRYDIISIEDPKNPHRVGSFELDTPGHSIHDVWVEDGIAYSSNWQDGVYMVDVGNGMAGGSLSNPVVIGHYAYPSGWNHAAFPYKDKETGKFYIVAGDEAFPYGLHIEDHPTYPRGWLHFIDFTDPKNPQEVARYQVPEAGSHNFWIEDDVLYVGYYNGGLRVVDLSGDLMGDLYEQGREIGFFLPTDPEGVVPNASMVWGPQPHKGKVFFSDWNSGLWAVEVEPPAAE